MRKSYIEDICALNRVTPAQYDVLYELMRYLTHDGHVNITRRIRLDICHALVIAPQTLSNRIQALARNNIIEVLHRNEYRLSSTLFDHREYCRACDSGGDLLLTLRYKANGERQVSTKFVSD